MERSNVTPDLNTEHFNSGELDMSRAEKSAFRKYHDNFAINWRFGIRINTIIVDFENRLWSRLMGPAAAEIIARDKEQIAEKRAAQDANKVEAVKEAGPDTVVDAAAELAKTS